MESLVHVPPAIGIVVISYNTCELLRSCLTSTTDPAHTVRVVVVDNASNDGSAGMVAREFPAVQLIANSENRGFAAATNQGLTALRNGADLLLLLNPDARLCPGALEEMAAFMQRHPRVGACGARLLYPDGRPQESAWHFPTLLMALFDLFPPRGPVFGRLYGSRLNGRYRDERGDEPFPIDHPLGAAMMIRRETLDDVGLFDEGYWMYAEEVDWCYRCREAGWAIWQVPAARVVHVGGASSAQFRSRSFIALHRSRARFERKWRSPAHRRWYSRIIRLGMTWAALGTWRAWWSGAVSRSELRSRLLAYGTVARLNINEPSMSRHSPEQP